MDRALTPPVVTRPERLPLLDPCFTFDQFQAFCLDLVAHLPAVGDAVLGDGPHHYGVPGNAQRGIDIRVYAE